MAILSDRTPQSSCELRQWNQFVSSVKVASVHLKLLCLHDNKICSLSLTAVKPMPKVVHLFDRALSNQIHTCAAQAGIVSSCLKSGITFCPLATPASFDEGFTVKIACSKYFFTCLFLFQKWMLDFQCKPITSFTHTLSSRFNPQTFRFQSRLLLFLLQEEVHFWYMWARYWKRIQHVHHRFMNTKNIIMAFFMFLKYRHIAVTAGQSAEEAAENAWRVRLVHQPFNHLCFVEVLWKTCWKNIRAAVNCLNLKKHLNMEKFPTSQNLVVCLLVPPRTGRALIYHFWQKSPHWHLRCSTALLASSAILSYSCLTVGRTGTQTGNLGLFLVSHPAHTGNKAEETTETYLQGQQCMQTACLHHFWALSICLPCFNINSVGISVVGCFYWWILRREIAFFVPPCPRREQPSATAPTPSMEPWAVQRSRSWCLWNCVFLKRSVF